MEAKKYKLRTDLVKIHNLTTLYRIEALKDLRYVKKGDLGGWVEKEDNLSQEGNCWVFNEACVYDNAKVCGDAQVYGKAEVWGNSKVLDDAEVDGETKVCGNVEIGGKSEVRCEAAILDNAKICGEAKVYDNARVYGNARIGGNALVCDNAEVWGDTNVYDYATICNNAEVYGQAIVHGRVTVDGCTKIMGDAELKCTTDYYVGKNTWSSGRFFTYTHSNKMWKVGCFYGTSEELIEKAYKDSELSGMEYERVVKYVEEMYKNLEKHNKHT